MAGATSTRHGCATPSVLSSHHGACRPAVRTTSSKTGYCGHNRAEATESHTGRRILHSLELNTCEARLSRTGRQRACGQHGNAPQVKHATSSHTSDTGPCHKLNLRHGRLDVTPYSPWTLCTRSPHRHSRVGYYGSLRGRRLRQKCSVPGG